MQPRLSFSSSKRYGMLSPSSVHSSVLLVCHGMDWFRLVYYKTVVSAEKPATCISQR
jgi:hypothetical protein